MGRAQRLTWTFSARGQGDRCRPRFLWSSANVWCATPRLPPPLPPSLLPSMLRASPLGQNRVGASLPFTVLLGEILWLAAGGACGRLTRDGNKLCLLTDALVDCLCVGSQGKVAVDSTRRELACWSSSRSLQVITAGPRGYCHCVRNNMSTLLCVVCYACLCSVCAGLVWMDLITFLFIFSRSFV
jgi:hypothetical protein